VKLVPVTVAISVKAEHPAPWQRSTRYWTTPTLSVAAVQARPTCVGLFDLPLDLVSAGEILVPLLHGVLVSTQICST
jgi:hypothetical protein